MSLGSPGWPTGIVPPGAGIRGTVPGFGPDALSLSDEGTVASRGAPEASWKGTRSQGGGPSTTVQPELMSVVCPWLAQYVASSPLYALTQDVLWLVVDLSSLTVP